MEGIIRLHAVIAEHLPEPVGPAGPAPQVVVGIETERGPWAAALVAAGYRVFAINPLSVARYRERHSTSGAKSDAADAHILAEIVRLDRAHHRQVAGDSALAEAVKLAARTHQSLIWDRTPQVLRLRSALRELFPAAVKAYDELDAADTLQLLRLAPDPDRSTRLTKRQVVAALAKANRRHPEVVAERMLAVLKAGELRQAPPVQAAFAAIVAAQVAVIATLNGQKEVRSGAGTAMGSGCLGELGAGVLVVDGDGVGRGAEPCREGVCAAGDLAGAVGELGGAGGELPGGGGDRVGTVGEVVGAGGELVQPGEELLGGGFGLLQPVGEVGAACGELFAGGGAGVHPVEDGVELRAQSRRGGGRVAGGDDGAELGLQGAEAGGELLEPVGDAGRAVVQSAHLVGELLGAGGGVAESVGEGVGAAGERSHAVRKLGGAVGERLGAGCGAVRTLGALGGAVVGVGEVIADGGEAEVDVLQVELGDLGVEHGGGGAGDDGSDGVVCELGAVAGGDVDGGGVWPCDAASTGRRAGCPTKYAEWSTAASCSVTAAQRTHAEPLSA